MEKLTCETITSKKMKFRKDINALRALAVLLVVIYHFTPNWLPGGFVGVDVFFVISGFLMTSIILNWRELNLSSLLNFYVARLNRIVPALAFLCFTLLLIGWFYLAGDAYEYLAKSVRYSSLFLSNQTYLEDAGYFAAASKENWLLHTWSLSIEWQFYLLYPVFIGVVYRLFSRSNLALAINLLLLSSLGYCCFLAVKGDSSGYFSLSARAWEMLLGSWGVLYQPKKLRSSYIGWIIILLSSLFINENNIWPSSLTLIPAFGALIILWSNHETKLNSSFIVQRIGLYSYSIYLWHWPVVVLFYKLSLNSVHWVFFGMLLSLVLGGISYHTVEKIRLNTNIYSFKALFLRCKPLGVVLLIVIAAKYISGQDGLPERNTLSPELVGLYDKLDKKIQTHPLRSKCHINRYAEHQPVGACTWPSDKPSWAVIGDSHASELSFSLANQLSLRDKALTQFSMSACPPSYTQPTEFSECANWTNEVMKTVIANDEIKNVVISYRYSLHLFGDNEDTYPKLPNEWSDERQEQVLASLKVMIDDLIDSGKQVHLLMPVPDMGRSIKSLVDNAYLRKKSLTDISSISLDYYHKRNDLIFTFISDLPNKEELNIIEVKDFFCDQHQCYAVRDNKPLYFDDNHPGLLITKDIATRILETET
ncbi:acyltransferase family protein [Vibrio sp. FJH11]